MTVARWQVDIIPASPMQASSTFTPTLDRTDV